jgi:RING finger/CHY zinc finger protein 1
MVMPVEYQDQLMTVQCNDCLNKCNVPFHIAGGKCTKCRSYNTTRVGEGLIKKEKVETEVEEL